MTGMEIVYLACPYSKGTALTRLARFNAVTHVAAKLIERRKIVFSPITMTHPIDLVLASDGATLGSVFWTTFDTAFMNACASISVLTLPGWQESSGVKFEISHFQNRGIEPCYLEPSEFGILREAMEFSAAFE